MKVKIQENVISLKAINIWLLVVMIIMSATVVFSTYRLTSSFMRLKSAASEHTDLVKAANELMDASDFLTERVQRFALSGNKRFMEDYFSEAFVTKRREDAISRMNVNEKTEAAYERLCKAMDNSVNLMDREYYAMRLVIEAMDITDYPEQLNDIILSDEDKALSAHEKMDKALEMVLGDEYYKQKDRIREEMMESVEEVDKLLVDTEAFELEALQKDLDTVRIVIVIQMVSILVIVFLTSHFGIDPILKAVDKIKDDSPVPEFGAKEFRYLAQAYNKMYSKYQLSFEKLNYKASHDELTGAYNRAGYDLLMSSIDLESTYMIMLDVDNFKDINDTYGHDTGDKVLKKLVQTLGTVFRDDDCICRIGGDEFVVFMVHAGSMQKRLIEAKINEINKELENTSDGLPAVSISVGVVHGKDAANSAALFEKTDAAMYESKRQGKNRLTFYSDETEK